MQQSNTLNIGLEQARQMYKSATGDLKKMLKDHFGEDALTTDPSSSIKSFEDACKTLGIAETLPDVSMMPEWNRKRAIADYKRVVIAKALNEGWEPNYADSSEYKWYPWFEYNPASGGFSLDGVFYGGTHSAVGARLVFRSKKLAQYFGENFTDLHNDYLKL